MYLLCYTRNSNITRKISIQLSPSVSVSYNGRLFDEKLGDRTSSYWKYLKVLDKLDENNFANLSYDDVVVDVKPLLVKYQQK